MRVGDRDFQWLVLLFLLALASVFFLNDFQNVFGFDPFDESIYLSQAMRGQIETVWGPLYVSYYRVLLALFGGDALFVYYLNLGLLSTAIPFLHFLLLRRLQVSPLLSFLSAYYLLIASFNAPLFAKAGHFNLVIIYLGLLAVSRLTTGILLYYLLVLFLIPTIFVRQDMLVVVGIMLIPLGYVIKVYSGQKSAIIKKVALGIIVLTGVLYFLFGNVFKSDRSWPVFSSLYYYNFSSPGASNIEAVIEADFGKVDSILAAYQANPRAIWRHVHKNLVEFPKRLGYALFYRYTVLGEQKALWGETALVVLLILVAGLGSGFLRWKKKNWQWWKRDAFSTAVCIVCLAILVKTALVVSFFWSGTARYFLEGIIAGIILFSLILDRWTVTKVPAWLVYVICGLLVVFVPRAKDCKNCPNITTVPPEYSAKEMIVFMKKLPGGVCYYSGCFDAFFGFHFQCFASGNSYDQSYPYPSEHRDLKSYLKAKSVDYVLVTESLNHVMWQYGKAEEFADFVNNHQRYGYPWKAEVRPGEFVISRKPLN